MMFCPICNKDGASFDRCGFGSKPSSAPTKFSMASTTGLDFGTPHTDSFSIVTDGKHESSTKEIIDGTIRKPS